MTTIDLRIMKTREKLFNAYLLLIKKKPTEDITIQELTMSANVNRVTFYKHFQNLTNFQDALIEHHILALYAFLKPLNHQPYSQGFEYEALVELLTYIKEHADVYKVLFTSPNLPHFNRELLAYFNKKIIKHTNELAKFDFPGTGVEQDIVAWYGVSALFGTTIMWLQSDFPYSPEQIAQAIIKLTPNSK